MDPVRDPKPDLYSIDGSVPPEVMQQYGEWLRRNPAHPGWHISLDLERKSLSLDEAADLFAVERADLAEVIAERAPVTAEFAVRMRAVIWMRMQIRYDLVRARSRLVRIGAILPEAVPADPVSPPPEPELKLDPDPVPGPETEPAAAPVG